MNPPKLFTAKLSSLNDNPKSAPQDSWNLPPDPRPSITVDSTQIPGLENWRVGDTQELEIKVKITQTKLNTSSKGDRTIATMLITHIGVEEREEDSRPIDMNIYK